MAIKSSGGKILRRVLRVVLFVFVLINLILASHAWKFTHFYDDPELRKPHESGFLSAAKFILAGNKIPKRLNDSVPAAKHTNVMLATEDSMHLQAWDIPCKGYWYDSLALLRSTLNYDHKGTVIIYHGHGSCRSALLPEANAFLRMGYNVFTIDFRAHGNSEGEQSLVGMKESADVKAAYDYVQKHGEKNIVLFGVSMGGAAVTKAINDYDLKPTKVILEMPFATMLNAVKGKLRIMKLPSFLAPGLAFWGGTLNGKWAFSHKPYLFAEKIKCPVLLQWGRQDPRVTVDETNEIYSHLGSADKKLVVYESAAHESLYKKEPAKWLQNVDAFLNK